MQVGYGLIERGEQLQSLASDADGDDAAVGRFARAGGETALFQAVDEARDVGVACDHSAADLVAGQPFLSGATQNAEGVVLSVGDAEGLEQCGFFLQESIGSAEEVEEGLFFERLKRLRLPDLFG